MAKYKATIKVEYEFEFEAYFEAYTDNRHLLEKKAEEIWEARNSIGLISNAYNETKIDVKEV